MLRGSSPTLFSVVTRKEVGSTCDTVFPSALATQTEPAPAATPIGPCPTVTVVCAGAPTPPVAGTTLVSVSPVPVTHRAPKPAAIRTEPPAKATGVPTTPLEASMGVTSLAITEVTQTERPSTARPEGP